MAREEEGDRSPYAHVRSEPPMGMLIPVVDALERISAIRDVYGRQLLADLLQEALGNLSIGDHAQPRKFFFNIVDACRRAPDGLTTLALTLNQLEPDSQPVREAADLLSDIEVLDSVHPTARNALRKLLAGIESRAVIQAHLTAAGANVRAQRPGSANAWDAYQDLARLNAGQDGLPPCLVFIEQIAAGQDEEQADKLRSWNDRQASQLGLGRELRKVRSGISAWTHIDHDTAYLVIQLAPIGRQRGRYLLSHWKQLDPTGWAPRRGDDQVVTLAEAERQVEKLIKAAEIEWTWFDGQIIIEFVLPRQLLGVSVERWFTETDSDQPIPLQIRYPVFLRSLERMRKREWHRVWRERWRRLRDNPGDVDTHWCRPDGEGYPTRLEARLLSDPRLVSMVLSTPPKRPKGQSAVDEVLVGLRSGVPLMVWHRIDCNRHEFHQIVINLLDGSLTELPERTKTLRRRGVEAMTHELEHVVVLLDSPERLVESDDLPGIAS